MNEYIYQGISEHRPSYFKSQSVATCTNRYCPARRFAKSKKPDGSTYERLVYQIKRVPLKGSPNLCPGCKHALYWERLTDEEIESKKCFADANYG